MRPSISYSREAPGSGRDHRSRSPSVRQDNEDRGLGDMLLDSFHVPRVLPPQLAALVISLKTKAATRRDDTRRSNDDPLAA
jgi:hypothetical protein